MSRNQRKLQLVDPKFQISFVLFFSSIFFFNFFIIYLALHLGKESFLQKLLKAEIPKDSVIFDFISVMSSDISLVLVFSTIFCVVFSIITGLVFSHRVSGPIYRIKQDLKAMKESGNYRNITIREKDYFKELAEIINEVIGDVKKRK